MRTDTREGFALRLLNYHSGGGSRVYALGSTLHVGHAPTYDCIRLARNELLQDAERPHRPGYGSKWLHVALRILAAQLTKWMQTGIAPWEIRIRRPDVHALQLHDHMLRPIPHAGGTYWETPEAWDFYIGDRRTSYTPKHIVESIQVRRRWVAAAEAEALPRPARSRSRLPF